MVWGQAGFSSEPSLARNFCRLAYEQPGPGGLYNIFEAWLLSSPPLPTRQVNMAESHEWIFRLFGRHHCKSRIFKRMENFQNDCYRSWTKKTFKNSYSRQLRIINAVVCCLCWSPAGQIAEIDWPKSVFLQDKVTLFETTTTTMNEANREKKKRYRINFFVMFRLSVLLLNSMSKLIHNRCTCKFVIKTLRLQTCMKTETNNCVFFYF